MLTNQTAFTAMRKHVLYQEKQCKGQHGCVYHDNGNHCAVGILIKDIELDDHLNTGGVNYIINKNEEVAKRLGSVSENLLRSCQQIHDEDWMWKLSPSQRRHEMDIEFQKIAKKFNLKIED